RPSAIAAATPSTSKTVCVGIRQDSVAIDVLGDDCSRGASVRLSNDDVVWKFADSDPRYFGGISASADRSVFPELKAGTAPGRSRARRRHRPASSRLPRRGPGPRAFRGSDASTTERSLRLRRRADGGALILAADREDPEECCP